MRKLKPWGEKRRLSFWKESNIILISSLSNLFMKIFVYIQRNSILLEKNININ